MSELGLGQVIVAVAEVICLVGLVMKLGRTLTK
jgi:hypothetical protein